MPPTINTLPSGKSVAVCPERGSIITPADATEPAGEDERAGTDASSATAATAKLIARVTTRLMPRDTRVCFIAILHRYIDGRNKQVLVRFLFLFPALHFHR